MVTGESDLLRETLLYLYVNLGQ